MNERMYGYGSIDQDDIGVTDDDPEGYSSEEVDEMLDGLIDAAENDADFAERRRRQQRKAQQRRPVPTAKGATPFRSPAQPGALVTQKQLEESLARVAVDIRRNAQGIKTINTQLGKVNTRVDGIVEVNRLQSRHLGKLDKQMKLDGALEIASSFDGTGITLLPILKGAIKSGFLADAKGALGNPLVIGAIGLLLNNPGLLSGLLPQAGGSNT